MVTLILVIIRISEWVCRREGAEQLAFHSLTIPSLLKDLLVIGVLIYNSNDLKIRVAGEA